MKRVLIIFFTIAMIYSSCKKINKLTNFYIDHTNCITIGDIQNSESNTEIWSFRINDSLSELCEENNTSKESVTQILLNRFIVTIKSPDTMNLDFVHSINIYISSKDMEQKKIAWTGDIQANDSQILKLNVSDDDIKDYISNGFTLVFQLTVNEKNNNIVKLSIDYSYLVTANLND